MPYMSCFQILFPFYVLEPMNSHIYSQILDLKDGRAGFTAIAQTDYGNHPFPFCFAPSAGPASDEQVLWNYNID